MGHQVMVRIRCPKLLNMSKCKAGVKIPTFLDRIQKVAPKETHRHNSRSRVKLAKETDSFCLEGRKADPRMSLCTKECQC